MDFNRVYARRGAVQSIEFRHVDLFGSDVYEVRQEVACQSGPFSWTQTDLLKTR